MLLDSEEENKKTMIKPFNNLKCLFQFTTISKNQNSHWHSKGT